LSAFQELWTRLTGKPALPSLATARLMASERNRSYFDHTKSERELGVRFRPVEETLRDAVLWYREHGWLGRDAGRQGQPSKRGQHAQAHQL
jgi:dihydroflavonol-4-reductase